MNVNQYQKYHKNTRNMKKGILASNIGALPILQECPRDVATVATCVAEALRQDCLEQVCLSFVCFPADFCFWSHYCLPFFFASVFWYNNKKGNQAHEP